MSDKNKLTVQEKIQNLNELVAWFQGEDFVLEEAIDRFKDAEKLAEDIEKSLNEIKNDIQTVKQRFDSQL